MQLSKLVVSAIVIGLALSFMVAFAFGAETPRVPYVGPNDTMCGVGMQLTLEGRPAPPALANELVLRLVNCDDSKKVRDKNGELVPNSVEIRRFEPEKTMQQMQLLRIVWDADGDGYGDYVAVVTGYDGEEPQFESSTIEGEKPLMAELWWFSAGDESDESTF